MSQIFISHVEEDANIAKEISRGLEQAGYSTWYYERDSVPGPTYLSQVGREIARAQAVVLIISVNSLSSHQVNSEVISTFEAGKPFIPILRDITHTEFQQRQPVWRQALGATTTLPIPKEGVYYILPRIVAGLHVLGFEPGDKNTVSSGSGEEISATTANSHKHNSTGEGKKSSGYIENAGLIVRPNWFWAGVTIASIGVIWVIGLAAFHYRSIDFPWWNDIIALLVLGLPLLIIGVIFLRKGLAHDRPSSARASGSENLLWILPVISGFIGGVISWLLEKDVNWRRAVNMLTAGILATIIWVMPFLPFHGAQTVSDTKPPQANTSAKTEIPPGAKTDNISPGTPATMPPGVAPLTLSNVIYEDNFSDAGSGWQQYSQSEYENGYINGEYYILLKKYDFYSSSINKRPEIPANFSYETSAKLASGPIDTWYGIVLRYSAPDNFYGFVISADGYYCVVKRADGVFIELQGRTKSAFIKQGNSSNKIKVTCKGSRMDMYINDTWVTTINDDTYTNGYIGMIVSGFQPNGRVTFDYVRVYRNE